MLEVEDLHVYYGRIAALRGVSIRVEGGEIVSVIGPNGAGKSSLLWTITGVIKATGGRISFEGQDLAGVTPEDIVRTGVSLVPEGRHIFASLSVADNLRLGATIRNDHAEVRKSVAELEDRFPVLAESRHRPAGSLSGGQQQQLAIARALLSRPRLLLLDEPSLGLDPHNTNMIFQLTNELRDAGTTVLLIEQNAVQSIGIADRTYILRTGQVALSGTREEVLAREDVRDMYLGFKGSSR